MKVSTIVLFFGILFGSIVLFLALPDYLGDQFKIFVLLIPLLFALKITFSQ